MHPAGYGSASGAIQELARIGAVEGVHYRLSADGEDIKDFIIAIDTGPMVVTMKGGFEAVPVDGPPGTFAVLNPAGMELVGAGMTAVQMREGKIPAEAAYVLAVE
jgi:hypothetical protein